MSALALLMLSQPALAWKHTGFVWDTPDIPREWYMDDGMEDGLPTPESSDWDEKYRESCGDEPYDFCIVQRSFENWYDAECARIGDTFVGPREDFGNPNAGDGRSIFYWDDPSDQVEVGVLGVTYPRGDSGSTIVINGESYTKATDADIVFNDNVQWGTTEDIEANNCNGGTAIEGVATHEIGHSWGMGHSCEQGEECDDALLLAATMYWSIGPCDLSQNDLNQDDIDGLTALYGPFATFEATTERYGAAPLTVCFETVSDDAVTAVTWEFGDGATSTELNPCHEYTTSGQFSVAVEYLFSDAECGDTTFNESRLAYVITCTEPIPEPGADGFFEVKHLDGLTYQTVNHTDLSVYGCVDTIEWQVYRGSSEADIQPGNIVDFNGDAAGEGIGAWAPKLTFPEEGSYVVVMNVGGPGGLVASFLVVEAEDRKGEGTGCASVPGSTAALGGLLIAAAAAFRRRRA